MTGDIVGDSRTVASAGPPQGKLLALDVGMARIGIAVSDPLQLRARPLAVVDRTSRRADFERLADFVRDEAAEAVICGLPLNMDGSEGEQARTVRKWAMRLAHALRALLGQPIPVIFWDERLSTYAANNHEVFDTVSVGEDAVAAAVILQRFLDHDTRSDESNYGVIVLPAKGSTARHPSDTRSEERPTADEESAAQGSYAE